MKTVTAKKYVILFRHSDGWTYYGTFDSCPSARREIRRLQALEKYTIATKYIIRVAKLIYTVRDEDFENLKP